MLLTAMLSPKRRRSSFHWAGDCQPDFEFYAVASIAEGIMSQDLEKRIAELEAREQVKELRSIYAWHAARGERDRIAALFAPDGIFEVKVRGERILLKGPDAIQAFLETSMWPNMVFPVIHNHVIDIDGDVAVGTCVMEAFTKARVAEHFPDGFLGYYHDRAVRQPDGRWLFAERRWFTYWPEFEDSGLPIRLEH